MRNVVQRPEEGKPFPSAIESERAIIGILLLFPERMGQAVGQDLLSEYFQAAPYTSIYEAMLALYSEGNTISVQSVYARMSALKTAAILDSYEREAHLVKLQNDCGSPDGLTDHIRAVKRAANEWTQALLREELRRQDLNQEQRQELGAKLDTLRAEHDALLSASAGWRGELGPPLPFEDLRPPAWPDGVLPSPLMEYVDAVSESVQVPRELAGMLALGCMSACWAGKVRAVLPGTGYSEDLCLYVVAAADVGERKSSTYAKFEGPIRQYEAERRQELAPQNSAYRAEREGIEVELRNAIGRRKMGKVKSDDYQDACDTARRLQEELDNLRGPPSPDFLTQDCTPEGLARLMSMTGGFACLMNPEGGGIFDIMAGRYSEIPNLDVFLKSYDGERLVIHRAAKERDLPPIERPSLAFVVTTQPATLRRLASRQELDERGLVARMLFAIVVDSRVGYRQASKPAIPGELIESYGNTLLRALRVSRPEAPHTLVFGRDAVAEYEALFERIEPRLRQKGDLHPMRGWACKLVGKIVRIAALIHLIERGADGAPWTIPLSGDAFRRAARLADYFIGHAQLAFSLMRQSAHLDAARKLLEALAQENKPQFTTREALRHIARNRAKEAVRPVLELLSLHNFIARTTARRSDSEAWLVNPRHVETWPARTGACARNSGHLGHFNDSRL